MYNVLNKKGVFLFYLAIFILKNGIIAFKNSIIAL